MNARIERRWDAATTHTVIWPAAALEPDRLAAACARVAAAAGPGSFVARRIAELARADGLLPHAFLAAAGGRFVTVSACRSHTALMDELERRERPALPFSFVLGDGGLALTHSHELGDGSVSAALLGALACAYRDGDAGSPVPSRIAGGGDLVRGLASRWWRRPCAAGAAAAGAYRRLRRPVAVARPVPRRARTEVVAIPPSGVAALDRWRRAYGAARPSMSVSLLWVVARALSGNGYPAGPQHWQVMVNLRAGAPALTGLGGNLIGRALVDVDPDGDPAPAAAQLRRQVASGEILALRVGKVAAEALRGRSARPPAGPPGAAAASPGPAGLAWSDRGRHAFGAGPGDVVAPGGGTQPMAFSYMMPRRDGIGVNVGWLGGGATLALTFGGCPLGDDGVDGVLRALGGGIAGLLPEPGGVHPFDAARPARRGRIPPAPSP